MKSAIYVEAHIKGDLEDVWEKTQNPKLHEKWDLRFSQIDYLPHDSGKPQLFEYRTRIGLGLEIGGQGETVGQKLDSASRTSALKFWSDDPRSLIRVGSGYWKYEASQEGVRFYTAYDYKTRFGALGRWVDRLLFRPLIGWATAWSFDRLRIWIEDGIEPRISFERALTHALCRGALAFTWLYHGLVPKILFPSVNELQILRSAPLMSNASPSTAAFVGLLEVAWAVALLLTWNRRGVLGANAILALGLNAVVLWQPSTLTEPFTPVTLNLCMFTLSIVGWLASRNLPSARRCLRKPPQENPSTRKRWEQSSTVCIR